jgi:hypothetical protein
MIEFLKSHKPIDLNLAKKLEQIVIKSIIYAETTENKTGFLNRTKPEENLKHFLNYLNIINYLKIDSRSIASKFEKNDLKEIFITESIDMDFNRDDIEKFMKVIDDKLIGIIIHTNEYYLENISLIKIYNQSDKNIINNIINVLDEDDFIDANNKFIFERIDGLKDILNNKKQKELRDELYEKYVTEYNNENYFGEFWGISFRVTLNSGITKQDLIGNDDMNGDKILDMLVEDKKGVLYYEGEIDNDDNFTGIDFEPENHSESDLKNEIRNHVLNRDWDSETILQEFLANNNFEIEILEKTFKGNKDNLRE